MKKQFFDIFLDPTKESISIVSKIQRIWQILPKQTYPDKKGYDIDNKEYFYNLEIKSGDNIWDNARKILDIEGVLEVDPIVGLSGWFRWLFNEDHDDYPNDSKWNLQTTGFSNNLLSSIQRTSDSKIKIFQLDTGYTEHVSIIDRVHKDILDKDIKLKCNYIGETPNTNSKDPLNGKHPSHGTSTASVILGRKTKDHEGVLANFPHIDFYPFRIGSSVVHILGDTISPAIHDAIDNGAGVITMSMGGAPPRRAWKMAVERAYKEGVIFIAAAGNQVETVVWPARYPEVIAVAGINCNDLPWEGSCSGVSVNISAPAENVYVARMEPNGNNPIPTYFFGSGTSYATPHVAAAAATWLHKYRTELTEEPFKSQPHKKVDAFKLGLKYSARVPNKWGAKIKANFGAGILDVKKLLELSPKTCLKKVPPFELEKGREQEESFSLVQKELMHLFYAENEIEEEKAIENIANSVSDNAQDTYRKLVMQHRFESSQKVFESRKTYGFQKWAFEKIHDLDN